MYLTVHQFLFLSLHPFFLRFFLFFPFYRGRSVFSCRTFSSPLESDSGIILTLEVCIQSISGVEDFFQHSLQPIDTVSLPNPMSNLFTQHARVSFPLPHTCAVCSSPFCKNQDLEQHASAVGHQAFLCACGKQFIRASCLTRHINSHVGTKYQCEWCDDRSFPRRDKLRDHLRAFHRFGPRALGQQLRGDMLPETSSDSRPSSPESMASTSAPSQHDPSAYGLAFPAPACTSASASVVNPGSGYAGYGLHHDRSVSRLKVF